MCGKDYPRLNHAKVEGAVIEVCERCSRFGTKVDVQETVYKPIKKPIIIADLNDSLDLVPEYGKIIAKIRQNKGLTRYDLAKTLNEKESVIRRLEEENLEPNEDLVKRVENFLGIKLRGKYEESRRQRQGKKQIDLTVGDVVEVS